MTIFSWYNYSHNKILVWYIVTLFLSLKKIHILYSGPNTEEAEEVEQPGIKSSGGCTVFVREANFLFSTQVKF